MESLQPETPQSLISELQQAKQRAEKLNSILNVAKAMAAEHTLDTLLPLILKEAASVVEADRCSLFILDRSRNELWSRVAQGANQKIHLPLGQGIAGMVAQTGESINIADAYDDARFNRDWDAKMDYRTKSILCVPMRDTRGEVTGVLQALNAIGGVFSTKDTELLLALGGQAAQAIENAMLNEEINRLFEGFVQASVMAIESRDPSTAGHSSRVAALTVTLAQMTEAASSGSYKDVSFTEEQIQEIRYASLLHDFGKIGVREPVLVKAEKLYPLELDNLKLRFEIARKDRQFASLSRRLDAIKLRGALELEAIDKEEDERLAKEFQELDNALEFIIQCNRPTVLAHGGFEQLRNIGNLSFYDSHHRPQPILSSTEMQTLSIPRGSLSTMERLEIESHVTHTFRFLSQIPWTRTLTRVPEIAYAHHEKLNGKGYPRAISVEQIPLQSKMMAISDIYDALTTGDRQYKKAIPHELALDILQTEAHKGQLDKELFHIFVEAHVVNRAFQDKTSG